MTVERTSSLRHVLEAGRDGEGVPQGDAVLDPLAGVVPPDILVGSVHHPHPVEHDVLDRGAVKTTQSRNNSFTCIGVLGFPRMMPWP